MSSVRLDLGSAVLRAADERGRRSHRPARGAPPIHRGRVVDESALVASLARLVHRAPRGRLVLALPAGAPRDGWEDMVETTRVALGARGVVAVPAPVAAVRGTRSARGGIVVDLGAELTEVSWAELNGFYVGASLPWGVRDVRADLVAHLEQRHGVAMSDDDLRDGWASGVVVARSREGHHRRIRIEEEDLAAVLGPRVREVRSLVDYLDRLRPGPGGPPLHLVVGGGALIGDLPRHLLDHVRQEWTVPEDPSGRVLAGLALR
jgi:actin-like ATPase involved in cell morphogenesis